jgi:hypothetical protein
MARTTKPTAHKPVFDEEGILRFAARESVPAGGTSPPVSGDPERVALTLQLKPDVADLLRAEAARKGKTIDQVVAKLVTKHLGKR